MMIMRPLAHIKISNPCCAPEEDKSAGKMMMMGALAHVRLSERSASQMPHSKLAALLGSLK